MEIDHAMRNQIQNKKYIKEMILCLKFQKNQGNDEDQKKAR